ncbi:hypothetical protein SAMN05660830_02704 [Halodesulfovibrio aestuarii]|uniref:Uncharacterized protein n=1 Tax=Halodesulfovibrio aestuarii TaxID=126333 RepID=A0A8G2CBI8_9BACT|nr:hypothetical protein SAMN05660830_02704 [Halodesulfovibrio aestuarii]
MPFLIDCFRIYPVYLACILLFVNIVCSIFCFDLRRAVSYHFFCKAGFKGHKSDISVVTNRTRFPFLLIGLFFAYPAYWFLQLPLHINGMMSIVVISITCFLYITPLLIFISSFFHAVATEGDTIYFIGIVPVFFTCKQKEIDLIGDQHGSWGIPISTLRRGVHRYSVAISDIRSVIFDSD